MMDTVIEALGSPYAPWWVLTGAAAIFLVAAARTGKRVLWGDLGDDWDE